MRQVEDDESGTRRDATGPSRAQGEVRSGGKDSQGQRKGMER